MDLGKFQKKIKTDYESSLSELIRLIQDKDDDFLSEQYYDADYENSYHYQFILEGLLHLDIYHLGQIGIIIKLIHEMKDTQ